MRHNVAAPSQIVHLMEAAVRRCALDLSGLSVLTEAATGPYAATASLAALAGARVYAYSPNQQAVAETRALGEEAGVAARMEFPATLDAAVLSVADIVTNTGYLRPLSAFRVAAMKSGAVIPLMYESWEFRASDLDLAACAERGIPVAGTNECHPAVDVFSFLGGMAVRQLEEAGVRLKGARVLLLCDNPFLNFITRGLEEAGCRVEPIGSASALIPNLFYDAILVALRPGPEPRLNSDDVNYLARSAKGAVIAQFWGDIDRCAAGAAGFSLWPLVAPARGHMGILPSALGPEPIIRLQTGGLKVGQMMARATDYQDALEQAVASGYGQKL